MSKLYIIILGVLLLGTMVYITGCAAEGDDGYITCDGNTCDVDHPYSNQDSNSCYASISDCESSTGKTCKDCS